jgi:hypothetical protein
MLSNIHLRGIDSTLMALLKQEALNREISVNTLVLTLLKRGLGLSTDRHLPIYHDLDHLAGTWNKQKANLFLKKIADFEKIDKDLWK